DRSPLNQVSAGGQLLQPSDVKSSKRATLFSELWNSRDSASARKWKPAMITLPRSILKQVCMYLARKLSIRLLHQRHGEDIPSRLARTEHLLRLIERCQNVPRLVALQFGTDRKQMSGLGLVHAHSRIGKSCKERAEAWNLTLPRAFCVLKLGVRHL